MHSSLSLSVPLRVYWLLGDGDGVRKIRAQLETATDAWEWGTAPIARGLATGMVAMLDRQWKVAEQALLSIAKRNRWGNFGLGLIAHILAAEALRQQNQLDLAAANLSELLSDPHVAQVLGCALLAGAQTIQNLADANWGKRLSSAEQIELKRWSAIAAGEPQRPAQQAELPAGLSAREAEVLQLICKGHSNKLIARELSLSLFTVKRHVANMLNKTALASRTELATWWMSESKSV